jgi:hypothetical protein
MKKQSNCLYCKTVFIFNDKSSTGKFCSSVCSGKYRTEHVVKPLIEEGKVDQAPTLRTYLSNERGYKCEECNISEWNGKDISLHVDHIDGNSDNNFPSNLRLLCPNCHSQTDTFCGRNKKNSKRSTYNQRYRIRKLVPGEGVEPPALTV